MLEENLIEAQRLNVQNVSLFKGSPMAVLAPAAPYLFTYDPKGDFARWVRTNGWGKAWGVFLSSDYPLDALRRHFRKFLSVQLPDKSTAFLRFYDPRVLREFLPLLDSSQVKQFFGPVKAIIMEDKDPSSILIFTHHKGHLHTDVRQAGG